MAIHCVDCTSLGEIPRWRQVYERINGIWNLSSDQGTAAWGVPMNSTPPKTNMEPQNGGLEDDFPFQRGDFPVPC